jgi:molecular chaperone GrpE
MPDADPTLELDADAFEEMEDLQALADEVAESTAQTAAEYQAEQEETGAEPQEEDLTKARDRIAELEQLAAEHKDKHHRLLADFANHRNRVARETQMAVTLAEKKLLLELLPAVDNLERCLSSKYNSIEDFHAGASLIHKQLLEVLRKTGVEALDVKVGDPFDAQHAEALTTTCAPGLPDGAVAAVYERGYMLKELLLRPARVVVNHRPNDLEPSAESGETLQ